MRLRCGLGSNQRYGDIMGHMDDWKAKLFSFLQSDLQTYAPNDKIPHKNHRTKALVDNLTLPHPTNFPPSQSVLQMLRTLLCGKKV